MSDAANPAVKARGLTKTYGSGSAQVSALSDVGFEIPSGEFVVLLGPSGSGKTTLLNLIGALESPSGGEVDVLGTPLAGLNERQRTHYRLHTVGFVFQFFNLVPTLTAAENVALLAEITGPDAAKRTDDVLDRVGLADRMNHFPAELSGGEQQRVSIARGLVKGSPLLLCDEPTGALDIETGVKVLATLDDAVRTFGRTVIVVTHNAVIANMADRVIRLQDGRVMSAEVNENRVRPDELSW
jgi:putative ABC transport system ATP-binding protein